jgi:hypothetical protein
MTTENLSTTESTTTRSSGRGFFLLGWLLLIGGIAGYFVQLFALKQFVVPWYIPTLATIAFVLMLMGLSRRRGILRFLGLAACGLLAAGEWHFVLVGSRTPAYAGPQTSEPTPAFTAIRADGTPFTERDLAGQPTVLVFYRGHF